jgi:hypothetical protein
MGRAAMMMLAVAAGLLRVACGAMDAESILLKEPRGIDVDSQDRVVVAYAGSQIVAVFTPDGRLARLLGRLDEPGADEGHFDEPSGVTVDVADSLYVADTNNDRICVFDCEGLFVRAIGDAEGPGKLNKPRGCEVDEQGNVLVADTENSRIVTFAADGSYLSHFGVEGPEDGQLERPYNLVLQDYGGWKRSLIVANTWDWRLDRYDWKKAEPEAAGEPKQAGEWVWAAKYWGFSPAMDVCVGPAGDLCGTSFNWQSVRRWTHDMTYKWDSTGSEYANPIYDMVGLGVPRLGVQPYGVAVNSKAEVFLTWPEADRVIRLPAAMREPPRPEVVRRRTTSAVIRYETLAAVPSLVEYSADGKHWRTAGAPGRRTKHAVRLSGLEPGTQYRYRVSYGCSFVPATGFFGREWRFATAAARGTVRYLDMPVLVVFYTDVYEPAKVAEGVKPPRALGPDGIAEVKRQLEQGAYYYFFSSRWRYNVRFDWAIVDGPQLVVEDPAALGTLEKADRERLDELLRTPRTDENRAEIAALLKEKLGDVIGEAEIERLTAPNRWTKGPNWVWETQEQIEAIAAQRGKRLADYGGVITLGCHWVWQEGEAPVDLPPGYVEPAEYEDPDAPPVRGHWRQAASGGLSPPLWEGVGRSAFNTGGDTLWLFAHEFGHQVDGQFYASGYQEFGFNHWSWSFLKGRFDGGFSGNGYVLRIFADEWFFASILGQVKTAVDADGDGLADDEPALVCDEKRFGSSPRRRDTDGDGLSDFDEMLLTYGLQSDAVRRERIIERAVPPRPDLPDTDGDGLRDGRDPYPLYPVPAAIAKRTPVLDGCIAPDEWSVYRTFRDPEFVGTLYMNWDEDALYLAIEADRWAVLEAKLDCKQDGFTWSNDNVTVTLTPQATDPIGPVEQWKVEVTVWDESVRGMVAYPFHNKRLYAPGKVRYAAGRQDGRMVLEVAVSRNARVGLEPRAGYAFDFACGLKPVGSPTKLVLFETDWFVGVTCTVKGE